MVALAIVSAKATVKSPFSVIFFHQLQQAVALRDIGVGHYAVAVSVNPITVFRVLIFFSVISAHSITPKAKAEIRLKVAKRATAALLSIRLGLICFSSILHTAREHIKVWVVLVYKPRGGLYTHL